ncbi:MAG: DUF6069 family protein [Candidatus Limnocylindria bacterium]
MATMGPGAADGTPERSPRAEVRVRAGRLWGGGVAVAVVAALTAAVGYLICEVVLDIALIPPAELVGGSSDTGSVLAQYIALGVVAALVATALLHFLLISTPRPFAFFGWIMTLVTVAAGVLPFATDHDLDSQVASAAVLVVLGAAIGSLVSGVGARSLLRSRPGP